MNGFNAIVTKITESPFFTFSKKPLEVIEKAVLFRLIFSLICVLMAASALVYPFSILGKVISWGYFNFGVKYIVAFIFVLLTIAAACWLSFHLWWKKRNKFAEYASSDFIALPFFSEIIKTFGEWLGMLYIVIGGAGGLFSLVFLGRNSGGMLSTILFGINFGEGGELLENIPMVGEVLVDIYYGILILVFRYAVILGPVIGIGIIFISRFISEKLWVLAAIANNTKKI